MITPALISAAYVIDLVVGDPKGILHPVVLMGRAIEKLEPWLRKNLATGPAGLALVLIVAGGSYLITSFIASMLLLVEGFIFSILAFALYAWLASTTLALRGLIDSVRAVMAACDEGDIEEARAQLALIVGRDTDELDEEGIRRAAVESLAENASDGVVAPLFYLALGGLPLAFAYKAVNTMDSMVGYKNEKYMVFGRAAARIDDVFNYIPARLTGILIVLATHMLSRFEGDDGPRAYTVMRQDGRLHTSPNAGVPEAAMAGALNVRLGGPSTYKGELSEKPYINEQGGSVDAEAADRAVRIIVMASFMALAAAVVFVLLWWGV